MRREDCAQSRARGDAFLFLFFFFFLKVERNKKSTLFRWLSLALAHSLRSKGKKKSQNPSSPASTPAAMLAELARSNEEEELIFCFFVRSRSCFRARSLRFQKEEEKVFFAPLHSLWRGRSVRSLEGASAFLLCSLRFAFKGKQRASSRASAQARARASGEEKH